MHLCCVWKCVLQSSRGQRLLSPLQPAHKPLKPLLLSSPSQELVSAKMDIAELKEQRLLDQKALAAARKESMS